MHKLSKPKDKYYI